MAEKIRMFGKGAFMTTAKKYLEVLREREPQLWKEPFPIRELFGKNLPEELGHGL